jgi:putative N6-adenine-specific DNA methylase
MPASRAGAKLEAGLRAFGLSERVRGAACVDVGAGAGGFTERLLDHGARRVIAVDVGRGQLREALRRDARVEVLEGASWKTLPLDVAPGPFDFFTVDVSFVAARTMLRGLAFRLRPGAEGIVLVKPQFELPDRLVRGGNVTDPALRRRALASVRAKAEPLGFAVVGSVDSPVAGKEGTVEILAHLRFGGRTERLPAPGKRRPRTARDIHRPPSAAPADADLRFFAIVAPGLEEVALAELRALDGAREVRQVAGGVDFSGPPTVGMAANLWSRTATRILVRVGELEARDFATLRRRASALPWERFINQDTPIRTSVAQTRSRLYHTGGIAENLERAIEDRLGRQGQPTGEATRVFARGVSDHWTLSVDTSGERLHRRGWREENAAAPMRETLAAGLLALCAWEPAVPLVDPMCGAGTIPIEACTIALGRAPGLGRGFAFERTPLGRGHAWAELRERAVQGVKDAEMAPIVGSDRSAAAIASARRNAERAGVARQVRFAVGELDALEPPAGNPGLVLVNPPYGRRLGRPAELRALVSKLGQILRARFAGWRAGILLPDPRLASGLRLRSAALCRLDNGGLPVFLARLAVPPA